MLQRIQTLFLLAAAVIQIIFITLPLSNFLLENNDTIQLYSYGYKQSNNDLLFRTTPLLILCIIILLLTLLDIFLYKKRILQIRICIYNMLLNVGLIGLLAYSISGFLKDYPVIARSYSATLAIPVASIILLFLAFRGIRKDELLVKAYERLR